MREGDAIVPGVVDVIVARMGEEAQLHRDDDELDDLDEEFVGEATTGLPFLDGIHEEELQFAAHSFFGEGPKGRLGWGTGGSLDVAGSRGEMDVWGNLGGGDIVMMMLVG